MNGNMLKSMMQLADFIKQRAVTVMTKRKLLFG